MDDVKPRSLEEGLVWDTVVLVVFTVVAAGLHVSIVVGAWVLQTLDFFQDAPLVEPPSMEVSMVVLKQSPSDMVHRATKAPDASGAPEPPKRKLPDIAPPKKQSDLAFEKKDAPEEQQGKNTNRSAERERLLKVMSALDDLPEGPEDQEASDPDSTAQQSINAGASGLTADPELAAYVASIRDMFRKNFRPLPTIAMNDPDISCTVRVRFNLDTGVVTDTGMHRHIKPRGVLPFLVIMLISVAILYVWTDLALYLPFKF